MSRGLLGSADLGPRALCAALCPAVHQPLGPPELRGRCPSPTLPDPRLCVFRDALEPQVIVAAPVFDVFQVELECHCCVSVLITGLLQG